MLCKLNNYYNEGNPGFDIFLRKGGFMSVKMSYISDVKLVRQDRFNKKNISSQVTRVSKKIGNIAGVKSKKIIPLKAIGNFTTEVPRVVPEEFEENIIHAVKGKEKELQNLE